MLLPPKRLCNIISGRSVCPRSNKWLENVNPVTMEITNYVPDSNFNDVNDAIESAKTSFQTFKFFQTLQNRADLCREIANQIHSRAEELAMAESIDTGMILFF